MSVHSASADHTTADTIRLSKREIGLWDITRLLAGIVAGVIFLWGAVLLIILGQGDGATLMTQAYAAQLSSGIVMTICGLVVSWLSITAQRAADKRAEQRAEVTALLRQQADTAERLDAVVTKVEGMAREVHDLLTEEKDQRTHSAKARSDVAQLQEDMGEVRRSVAELSMKMPVEEAMLGRLKAYIDAVFVEFKKILDEAVKVARADGYLQGSHARLNGSRGHLQVVDTD